MSDPLGRHFSPFLRECLLGLRLECNESKMLLFMVGHLSSALQQNGSVDLYKSFVWGGGANNKWENSHHKILANCGFDLIYHYKANRLEWPLGCKFRPIQVRLEDGRRCSPIATCPQAYCCSDICSDRQQWYMHLGCRKHNVDVMPSLHA